MHNEKAKKVNRENTGASGKGHILGTVCEVGVCLGDYRQRQILFIYFLLKKYQSPFPSTPPTRMVRMERERERETWPKQQQRERPLGLGEAGMWMSGGHTKLFN